MEFSVTLKHSGLPFVTIMHKKDASQHQMWRTASTVLVRGGGQGGIGPQKYLGRNKDTV